MPIQLAVVCSFANSLIHGRCLVGQLAQVSVVVVMVTASPPSSPCQPFVDFFFFFLLRSSRVRRRCEFDIVFIHPLRLARRVWFPVGGLQKDL